MAVPEHQVSLWRHSAIDVLRQAESATHWHRRPNRKMELSMEYPETARVRTGIVLTAVVLANSAVLLGTTILNVALPGMTVALELSNTAQQWVLNSYTLTFAGFLLVAGTVGGRFGLRQTLLVGLTGFIVTTTLASLPLTVWFIIAMRALMGVFAAAIMPTTLAIITRAFSGPRRGGAIALWAAISGAAISAGPLLGGALLGFGLWWGSLLILVALIALVALALTWVGIRLGPASREAGRMRFAPVMISIVGIVLLVWGVLNGGERGQWLSWDTLLPLVGGVLVLSVLVTFEARAPHPVADVRLFRHAGFTVPVIALSLGSFVIFGYLYIATFYLQVERGFTPLQTGLAFLPQSIAMLIGSPLSNRLSTRFGPRATMIFGLLLTAGGFAGLALISAGTPLFWFLADMFIVAFGFALVLTTGTTVAMSAIPEHRSSAGSALLNTLRQLASALGVALLSSILWSHYRGSITPELTSLPHEDRASASESLTTTLQIVGGDEHLVSAAQYAFDSAMSLTAIIAAALSLLAALIAPASRAASRDRQPPEDHNPSEVEA